MAKRYFVQEVTEQILDNRQAGLEGLSTLEDEKYSKNEDHVSFNSEFESEFDDDCE